VIQNIFLTLLVYQPVNTTMVDNDFRSNQITNDTAASTFVP